MELSILCHYFRPVDTRELLQEFMTEGKSYVGVEQLIRDDIHLLLLCAKSREVSTYNLMLRAQMH